MFFMHYKKTLYLLLIASTVTGVCTSEITLLQGGQSVVSLFEVDGVRYVAKTPREHRDQKKSERFNGLIVHEIDALYAIPPHPCIVKINRFLSSKQDCKLVIEYADGGDLDTYSINNCSEISEEAIGKIFVQLMLGLYHLHGNGWIHRDVKLDNIFISSKGIIKIGDFGLVISSDEIDKEARGSACYCSPEVCRGEGHSNKSDMWSAGIALYLLLKGKCPVDADKKDPHKKFMYVMPKILDRHHRPLHIGRYSQDMQDLVAGLLQKDPARRLSAFDVLCLPYMQRFLTLVLNDIIRMGDIVLMREMLEAVDSLVTAAHSKQIMGDEFLNLKAAMESLGSGSTETKE